MIALLVATALAAPGIVLGAGLETPLNDPYMVRRGIRLGGAVAPWPWLEVGILGAVHPVSTDDLIALRRRDLGDGFSVMAATSPIRARAALTLDLPALRIDVGDSSVSVG